MHMVLAELVNISKLFELKTEILLLVNIKKITTGNDINVIKSRARSVMSHKMKYIMPTWLGYTK